MKGMKIKYVLFLCLCGSLLSLTGCVKDKRGDMTFAELEEAFKTVPDSTKIGVYWYWISNNISAEGVVKDLQSMKKAGINRAFIGNIGLTEVAQGKSKVMTDEWWKVIHTALKTATELGIEIGIFNSPGWSQSGGPWIKKHQSMRYLDHASVLVDGGNNLEITLPKMENTQSIKVLAYPCIPEVSEKWSFTKKIGESVSIEMKAPDKNMRSFILKRSSIN